MLAAVSAVKPAVKLNVMTNLRLILLQSFRQKLLATLLAAGLCRKFNSFL